MSIDIEEEDSSTTDMPWEDVKATILKLYLEPKRPKLVSEHLMIQQQNDLMQQIQDKVYRAHLKQSEAVEMSVQSFNMNYCLDDQCLIKSKFTQEFEFSLVNSALKEVKSKCSQQAYSTVINFVINNKQKQCESLRLTLQRKNTQLEQISLALILKQNEFSKFKQQVNPYIVNAQYLQQEKRKCKKKNDQLIEKQNRIHNAQNALFFKEKLHQEIKKKSERLREFTNQIYTKMKQIETQLNAVWNHIIKQMENKSVEPCCNQIDAKGCWKKQVMRKCRQKLLQERNLLKEEQRQLQKQYQNLQSISQQWRRLLNQKNQQNPDPNSNQIDQNLKLQKINSIYLVPPQLPKIFP